MQVNATHSECLQVTITPAFLALKSWFFLVSKEIGEKMTVTATRPAWLLRVLLQLIAKKYKIREHQRWERNGV